MLFSLNPMWMFLIPNHIIDRDLEDETLFRVFNVPFRHFFTHRFAHSLSLSYTIRVVKPYHLYDIMYVDLQSTRIYRIAHIYR